MIHCGRRILVQPLLLVHCLSLVNQLADSLDPSLRLLFGLGHEVKVALATMKHQGEAEVSRELLSDAQQDLRLVPLAHRLHLAH